MSYFTLKNGEKLYYEDKGNGPATLIMMHGWTSSHDIYQKPVETLQKQARCIIYDHRGHGGSKEANSGKPTMETLASDLNELIQGLSLSNITLLGWSMGAGTVSGQVYEGGDGKRCGQGFLLPVQRIRYRSRSQTGKDTGLSSQKTSEENTCKV